VRTFTHPRAVPQPALHTIRLAQRGGPFLLCAFLLGGCDQSGTPVQVEGGSADAGKRLVAQYQCGACHAIPGVAGAFGNAGPPLEYFGRRSYIAGGIPNLPDQLVRWLENPPAMKPGTAMPDLGISQEDARHMAAYLYTLR
jgi:cytochrome c2